MIIKENLTMENILPFKGGHGIENKKEFLLNIYNESSKAYVSSKSNKQSFTGGEALILYKNIIPFDRNFTSFLPCSEFLDNKEENEILFFSNLSISQSLGMNFSSPVKSFKLNKSTLEVTTKDGIQNAPFIGGALLSLSGNVANYKPYFLFFQNIILSLNFNPLRDFILDPFTFTPYQSLSLFFNSGQEDEMEIEQEEFFELFNSKTKIIKCPKYCFSSEKFSQPYVFRNNNWEEITLSGDVLKYEEILTSGNTYNEYINIQEQKFIDFFGEKNIYIHCNDYILPVCLKNSILTNIYDISNFILLSPQSARWSLNIGDL